MRGYDKASFEYYAEQRGPAIIEFYPLYEGEKPEIHIGYINKQWGKYIILPLDTRQPRIRFSPYQVKQMMWLDNRVILPKNRNSKRDSKKMTICELDEYLQKFGYELY